MLKLRAPSQAIKEKGVHRSIEPSTKITTPNLALSQKASARLASDLGVTVTTARRSVGTSARSIEENPTLDSNGPLDLFSKAAAEVDLPLLLTTAATATALASAWSCAAGGEYWTAASRAAVVAMLRTMGADYVTQLGKHKFSCADGKGRHATEKLPLANEFQPDLNRTCSMGMFYALYYIGPFSYVLTELYPRWFGNDGSWQEVWTKVVVENVLWMPIGYWTLWSLFKVGIDSYLQRAPHGADPAGDAGNSLEKLARGVWQDITSDFWKKNLACMGFWGPADIFNFKFVPQYDVPTAMVVEGAIWAAILGTIEYDQKIKSAEDV